jgi:outer membrane protein TolC
MNRHAQVDRATSNASPVRSPILFKAAMPRLFSIARGAADPPRLAILLAVSLAFFPQIGGSITLDGVLNTTLEKNLAIQRAKLNLEQAAGHRLVLRSIAWPSLKLGVPAGVQGGARSGESGIKVFGFARGFFTQPLLNAAIPPSFRRGDVDVLIAQQQLNLAIEQQLHAARLAFYSGLYNRDLLSTREKQRQHLDQNVASQEDRYHAGLADRGTIASATMQARELDPMVENARRGYGAAQLELAQLMATDLKSDESLPEPEGELSFAPVDVDLQSETAAALERRTDIKLARLLVRAANEDERIIAAGYYPDVSGSVTGDYIPVTGIHREGSTSRVDDFVGSEIREGAALSWRVIDNGKVGGALLKQRKAREINEVELQKLETSIGRELARIRNDLIGIEAKHKSLAAGTQSAADTVTGVQQNLGSGLSSQLEYRLAEGSYLKTETGVLEASYLQNVSLAEWDRATGRYFQFSEDMH